MPLMTFTRQAFRVIHPYLKSITPCIPTAPRTSYRGIANMATPYNIHVSASDTGLLKTEQTDEAAAKTSELLNKDLHDHHVFFNDKHMHNHITHHLLSLFGTGAGLGAIQRGYDGNTHYQRPARPAHEGRAPAEPLIGSWDQAAPYLGREEYYPDFLAFFQREAVRLGSWQAVVRAHLLGGSGAADDLLARLFAGFVHPLIQLMYGLEWAQPAIVAEGLAQAAVHGAYMKDFYLRAEAEAGAGAGAESAGSAAGTGGRMPAIADLVEEVRASEALAGAARASEGSRLRDGVLAHALDDMVRVAARVRVGPDEVDERTAEMFDACVYVAAAAAMHPPKHVKFDFFLMHHVNSSPFVVALNKQDWVSPEVKARVLEWKIRTLLLQFAACGSPQFNWDKVVSYQPKDRDTTQPYLKDVFARLHNLDDDGHAIKLSRAIAICQDISAAYEDRDWVKVKGQDIWAKIQYMVLDSVEGPGDRWVRSAGIEENWKDIEDYPKL